MAKTKSKFIGILMLICLTIPFMFMLVGCGDNHEHDYVNPTYIIEDEKAYEIKTCDCGEEQKTEIENSVVANASNIASKIASAESGSMIVLSEGNYSFISLKGTDAFNDNITLTAFDEVSVDGLLITSGLKKDEYGTKSSTMSENLTITNIKFIDDIQVRNCTISGLTIKNCTFKGEARIDMKADNFFASYLTHPDAKDGDMIKFGYDDIKTGGDVNSIINVTIENNTFEGEHDSVLSDTTMIYLSKVNGATVKNNVVNCAEFNGIQITNNSTGKILVEGNTIKNTGSRSMRFSYFKDSAELIVKNNVLSNANTLETNGEVVKSSDTGNATVVYEGNTYNGEAISVGNNITKA